MLGGEEVEDVVNRPLEMKNIIQLTLEQHTFELCGSTYTQIFPINTYHSATQSVDVEPRLRGPTVKLYT